MRDEVSIKRLLFIFLTDLKQLKGRRLNFRRGGYPMTATNDCVSVEARVI